MIFLSLLISCGSKVSPLKNKRTDHITEIANTYISWKGMSFADAIKNLVKLEESDNPINFKVVVDEAPELFNELFSFYLKMSKEKALSSINNKDLSPIFSDNFSYIHFQTISKLLESEAVFEDFNNFVDWLFKKGKKFVSYYLNNNIGISKEQQILIVTRAINSEHRDLLVSFVKQSSFKDAVDLLFYSFNKEVIEIIDEAELNLEEKIEENNLVFHAVESGYSTEAIEFIIKRLGPESIYNDIEIPSPTKSTPVLGKEGEEYQIKVGFSEKDCLKLPFILAINKNRDDIHTIFKGLSNKFIQNRFNCISILGLVRNSNLDVFKSVVHLVSANAERVQRLDSNSTIEEIENGYVIEDPERWEIMFRAFFNKDKGLPTSMRGNNNILQRMIELDLERLIEEFKIEDMGKSNHGGQKKLCDYLVNQAEPFETYLTMALRKKKYQFVENCLNKLGDKVQPGQASGKEGDDLEGAGEEIRGKSLIQLTVQLLVDTNSVEEKESLRRIFNLCLKADSSTFTSAVADLISFDGLERKIPLLHALCKAQEVDLIRNSLGLNKKDGFIKILLSPNYYLDNYSDGTKISPDFYCNQNEEIVKLLSQAKDNMRKNMKN